MSGYNGERHHNWKGGQHYQTPKGYILVRLADDFFLPMCKVGRVVLEHRLVVAKSLGRCLTNDEIVHHINGVRNDNRLENLVVLNKHNHPHNTYIGFLQERIRELEVAQDTG